jgi:hypothetical protein
MPPISAICGLFRCDDDREIFLTWPWPGMMVLEFRRSGIGRAPKMAWSKQGFLAFPAYSR